MTTLWSPASLGAIEPPHRLTMAPMTRDRSRRSGRHGWWERPLRSGYSCSRPLGGVPVEARETIGLDDR
jgi:hypothetical protein